MESDVALIAADLKKRAAAMANGANLEAPDMDHPKRDRVVRQMLRAGSELMNSCSTLAHGPHEHAVNVLIRSLIEIGLKIHWATLSEQNAAHLEASTKEQIKTIFKANAATGIARIVDAEGNDVTRDFVSSGRAERSQKRLSLEEMASQCGLLDIYNVFYRFQSMHTHANDLVSESSETDPVTLNCVGAFSTFLGHAGVRWIVGRGRPDNEEIRALLGLSSRTHL